MNKLILLALLLSAPSFAQVLMMESPKVEKKYNPYESHFITYFGFEGLKYEVPFNFRGARQTFSPRDQELWGGRIGIGEEIYLGGGITTTTKVEGYYVGTLFSRVVNGGPEDDSVDFAFTKRTGQVYGVDASQALGFIFDMKTKNPFLEEWSYLTVEPYVEIGIGFASAYNRLNYNFDTGTTPTAAQEAYRLRVTDQIINSKLGAGVNFTSSEGYFFFMKATVNKFDIPKRKSVGFSQPNGQPTELIDITDKTVKMDPTMTYAIGGGYKF